MKIIALLWIVVIADLTAHLLPLGFSTLIRLPALNPVNRRKQFSLGSFNRNSNDRNKKRRKREGTEY